MLQHQVLQLAVVSWQETGQGQQSLKSFIMGHALTVNPVDGVTLTGVGHNG